jgi:hypothetical protein
MPPSIDLFTVDSLPLHSQQKQPNLKLKTRHKQLLGSLPLAFPFLAFTLSLNKLVRLPSSRLVSWGVMLCSTREGSQFLAQILD